MAGGSEGFTCAARESEPATGPTESGPSPAASAADAIVASSCGTPPGHPARISASRNGAPMRSAAMLRRSAMSRTMAGMSSRRASSEGIVIRLPEKSDANHGAILPSPAARSRGWLVVAMMVTPLARPTACAISSCCGRGRRSASSTTQVVGRTPAGIEGFTSERPSTTTISPAPSRTAPASRASERLPMPGVPSMQTHEPARASSSTGSIQSRRCFGPCTRLPARLTAPP